MKINWTRKEFIPEKDWNAEVIKLEAELEFARRMAGHIDSSGYSSTYISNMPLYTMTSLGSNSITVGNTGNYTWSTKIKI